MLSNSPTVFQKDISSIIIICGTEKIIMKLSLCNFLQSSLPFSF